MYVTIARDDTQSSESIRIYVSPNYLDCQLSILIIADELCFENYLYSCFELALNGYVQRTPNNVLCNNELI